MIERDERSSEEEEEIILQSAEEEPERFNNLQTLLHLHKCLIVHHLAKGESVSTFKLTRYFLDVMEEASWATRFLREAIDVLPENPLYVARRKLLLAFREHRNDANFQAWLQHIMAHTGEESHLTVEWKRKVGPDNYYICRCMPTELEPGAQRRRRIDCAICSAQPLRCGECGKQHNGEGCLH